MAHSLTPEENLALSLIFVLLGKTSRYLSTGEYEYAAIAARARNLKELRHAVRARIVGALSESPAIFLSWTPRLMRRCFGYRFAKPNGTLPR